MGILCNDIIQRVVLQNWENGVHNNILRTFPWLELEELGPKKYEM